MANIQVTLLNLSLKVIALVVSKNVGTFSPRVGPSVVSSCTYSRTLPIEGLMRCMAILE